MLSLETVNGIIWGIACVVAMVFARYVWETSPKGDFDKIFPTLLSILGCLCGLVSIAICIHYKFGW